MIQKFYSDDSNEKQDFKDETSDEEDNRTKQMLIYFYD